MSMVDVAAPIMGDVTIVHVEDGASVAAGEAILEIECMKTLYTAAAPVAGRARLLVALGRTVAEGDIVARIETD